MVINLVTFLGYQHNFRKQSFWENVMIFKDYLQKIVKKQV